MVRADDNLSSGVARPVGWKTEERMMSALSQTRPPNRCHRALTAALIASALVFPTLTPADATQNQNRMCGKRDKIAALLHNRFDEAPIGVGVGRSGKTVYEVYTSAKGTWTVMVTIASGLSCIMASGHSWEGENPISHLPKT